MTRLDHNRAIAQLADKSDMPVSAVRRMIIWGNHSSTQYPDISHCLVDGGAGRSARRTQLGRRHLHPGVQQRGAAIIKARGASSAASAASAAIDHIRDWVHGSAGGDWVSMAVPSDGSYGIAEGVIYSYPVSARTGLSNRAGLAIDAFSRTRMDASTSKSSARSATACRVCFADHHESRRAHAPRCTSAWLGAAHTLRTRRHGRL